MGHLEQLKVALSETIKLIRSGDFNQYSKDEQQFFRGYIKELNDEIAAEYEAMEFIRQRDKEKEHATV